jgi:hypothetical protein
MKISDIFIIENARSKAFSDHESGRIPFITNGLENRGVLGFVTPLTQERVFDKKAIVVSSFCEVSVQDPPFLPRGNGGSGLIVLIPKIKMTAEELYSFASQIEKEKWRFSFGRMVIGDRLKNLELKNKRFNFSVSKYLNKNMPRSPLPRVSKKISKIKWVSLSSLGKLERKYAPYINEINLSKSVTPYVTTTEYNNGVAVFCNEKPNFNKGCISISLDGTCGTTFYQFQNFISGEKTAVLILNENYSNIPVLFYVASLIRLLSWRYHYGRKLSMERLKDFLIPIPINDKGKIDLKYIESLVSSCYGFVEMKKYI